jgi:hypothetical protein
MNRTIGIAAVVGLLLGVLGGFLFWGLPARRLQTDLRQALERPATLERDLDEARRQATKSEGELRTAQQQLKELEGDLARERDRRGKLEAIVSQGRK